jgi:protein-tyrosine phosphatase
MNAYSLSILFVCHANICRSPTAEAVFRAKAQAAGLECKIDSAGTNQRKSGILPDKRSIKAANAKGYSFEGISSEPVNKDKIASYDFILPMDTKNVDNLKKLVPEIHHNKIQLFMEYASENIRSRVMEVPDPFHGASHSFTVALSLIEYASDGLIAHIQNN